MSYILYNLKLTIIMNIVTGEKLQDLCDMFVGYQNDFYYNPYIAQQKDRHFYLNFYQNGLQLDNPYYIFCYSHQIPDLSVRIQMFKNRFVLVSHNSDGIIDETPEVLNILNHPNLDGWFAQNLCFDHPKLHFIPIGIANRQWPHGNVDVYRNAALYFRSNKIRNVYFNFNIDTNRSKRLPCYESLKGRLDWLGNVSPPENIARLSQYKFCVCPEGNGPDTHRLWEALYLRVVPIVVESNFTETLKKNNIPLIVLDSWDDFDETTLDYDVSIKMFDDKTFQQIINFTPLYFDQRIINK